MKKLIVTIVLSLLSFTSIVFAATTDFTADNNVTVSSVIFGTGTIDFVILNGSTAESISFASGVFTVTNPGIAFKVTASDSTVKAMVVTKGDGTGSVCADNTIPGTTFVTLSTTADTYTVAPSASYCSQLCGTIPGAVTYNAYPTCGAASCKSGYTLSGSGASGTCNASGGGGIVGGSGIISGGGTTLTPTYSDGSLLRASNSNHVYLLSGGQKRLIPTAEVFIGNGYSWASIKVVDPNVLSQYTEGSNVLMAATADIPEGGLIRANGEVDVYIVKYVGVKKFKRLILSPSVFNSYSHLKWSDIKDVDKSVLDSFTTSDLVRAVGDPKVYKLYPDGDTGEKRWVKTAEAFARLGFDWDAIYQINTVDRNSYTAGTVLE